MMGLFGSVGLSQVIAGIIFAIGVFGIIVFFIKPKPDVNDPFGSTPKPNRKLVGWNALESVAIVIAIYIMAQLIGGLVVSAYLSATNHPLNDINALIQASPNTQFLFVTATDSVALYMVYAFLKRRYTLPSAIGWVKPKFQDIFYALGGFVVYIVSYAFLDEVVRQVLPSLDLNQAQDIGFDTSISGYALIPVFISLVILPPLVEELITRGVLYSGLKRQLPIIWAALITSMIFAAAHLPESKGSGLLWVGAIDTFTLSLVLVYLREKTGSLWASIGLHGLKNGIAFMALFVFHLS